MKSERVLPQVRCEHRYTDGHLRAQHGQTKIVECFLFLVLRDGVTDIQTKLFFCYSASFRAGLDLTYDTGSRLGLNWTVLRTQVPAWGWIGPYL